MPQVNTEDYEQNHRERKHRIPRFHFLPLTANFPQDPTPQQNVEAPGNASVREKEKSGRNRGAQPSFMLRRRRSGINGARSTFLARIDPATNRSNTTLRGPL